MKAEFLMAQVDLDPIESYGSQEISTANQRKSGLTSQQPNTAATQLPTVSEFQAKPPTGKKSPQKHQLPDLTSQEMRDFLMSLLNRFDCRMEYDAEILNLDYSVRKPTEHDIVDYCKYVTIACKMEHEIPIIALVYIERLLMTTGILLNRFNWQRVLLCCLCLASKIWDDDSLEN